MALVTVCARASMERFLVSLVAGGNPRAGRFGPPSFVGDVMRMRCGRCLTNSRAHGSVHVLDNTERAVVHPHNFVAAPMERAP